MDEELKGIIGAASRAYPDSNFILGGDLNRDPAKVAALVRIINLNNFDAPIQGSLITRSQVRFGVIIENRTDYCLSNCKLSSQKAPQPPIETLLDHHPLISSIMLSGNIPSAPRRSAIIHRPKADLTTDELTDILCTRTSREDH